MDTPVTLDKEHEILKKQADKLFLGVFYKSKARPRTDSQFQRLDKYDFHFLGETPETYDTLLNFENANDFEGFWAVCSFYRKGRATAASQFVYAYDQETPLEREIRFGFMTREQAEALPVDPFLFWGKDELTHRMQTDPFLWERVLTQEMKTEIALIRQKFRSMPRPHEQSRLNKYNFHYQGETPEAYDFLMTFEKLDNYVQFTYFYKQCLWRFPSYQFREPKNTFDRRPDNPPLYTEENPLERESRLWGLTPEQILQKEAVYEAMQPPVEAVPAPASGTVLPSGPTSPPPAVSPVQNVSDIIDTDSFFVEDSGNSDSVFMQEPNLDSLPPEETDQPPFFPEDEPFWSSEEAAENEAFFPEFFENQQEETEEFKILREQRAKEAYTDAHLQDLNPAQREAAEWDKGSLLVVAGPGTGKTKTLVSHVTDLLKKGEKPDKIMLLTFTKKAAREMKDRAITMHPAAKYIWCGTFHGLAYKILKDASAGSRCRWSILGPKDVKNAFYSHMRVYFKQYKSPVIETFLLSRPSIMSQYHQCKTPYQQRLFFEETLDDNESGYQKAKKDEKENKYVRLSPYRSELLYHMNEINNTFTFWKQAGNKLEYDDIVPECNQLLERREELRKKFNRLCIDEYQDTSPDQARFVELLSGHVASTLAVGDDGQAIYEWRGASVRHMLHFSEISDNVIKLETNYRSSNAIVDDTNAILGAVSKKLEKVFVPARTENGQQFLRGSGIAYTPQVFEDPRQQAISLRETIQKTKEKGGKYSDWAILFRSHGGSGSILLKKELSRAHIPFKVFGGSPLFEKESMEQIAAVLRLHEDSTDIDSWKILFQNLKGLGEKKAEIVVTKCLEGGEKLAKAESPSNTIELRHIVTFIATEHATLFPKGQSSEKIQALKEALGYKNNKWENSLIAAEVIDNIVLWCILLKSELLLKKKDKGERSEQLEKDALAVATSIVQDETDFLKEQIEEEQTRNDQKILSFSEVIDLIYLGENKDEIDTEDKVTLSTIHSAKGLEWKNVCVADLNEGSFPSSRWKEGFQERVTTWPTEAGTHFYDFIPCDEEKKQIERVFKDKSIFGSIQSSEDFAPRLKEFMKDRLLTAGAEKWCQNILEDVKNEERRLFYVAVSRAQEKLILTRWKYDCLTDRCPQPSVFLNYLPENRVSYPDFQIKPFATTASSPSFFPKPAIFVPPCPEKALVHGKSMDTTLKKNELKPDSIVSIFSQHFTQALKSQPQKTKIEEISQQPLSSTASTPLPKKSLVTSRFQQYFEKMSQSKRSEAKDEDKEAEPVPLTQKPFKFTP